MRTIFNHLQASKPTHTMTSTTSTKLYDASCVAAAKANQHRFKAAKLSVPDELNWYNDNTDWDALTRKEFREIMIRMENVTEQFYNDFGDCTYPSRNAAIKKFWADEWGCEYLPESGKWRDLASGSIIESETEKKVDRDLKKAAKAAKKEAKEAKKAAKALTKEAKKADKPQYNDEEEEMYEQAAVYNQQQKQAQAQQKQQQAYDAWFDAEEEAYAEAYAEARAQEEQKELKAQAQKEQDEAQAYLDSLTYSSDEDESTTTRITCQAVLYIEELTDVQGDPDWRAYIYYDERIRRYVFKGTRRSLRATGKKTVYPEVRLCFRSSNELAHYLCSSTDSLLNVSMFAMASATVKDATFAELYALPARGYKTELFGYDQTRPRFSTFVNYLCMVRDIDATHSTFASF